MEVWGYGGVGVWEYGRDKESESRRIGEPGKKNAFRLRLPDSPTHKKRPSHSIPDNLPVLAHLGGAVVDAVLGIPQDSLVAAEAAPGHTHLVAAPS